MQACSPVRYGPYHSLSASIHTAHWSHAPLRPAPWPRRMQVELRAQDLPWQRFLDGAPPPPPAMLPAHVADAEEITNIIFSSGTTGQPLDVLGTRFLCRHCRLLCRYHGVCTAQPAHPITPSNAMPACLPACLQASPRPSPGPTSRPCARVPTLSSTRMCSRATCCAGPPTWAG